MYSSSLSTHRCICVLHCSKQCYSSSPRRPFSSCAVFAFTSSTDGKCVPFSTLFTLVYRKKSQGTKSANMEDVQVFECVYWEETSRAKGRCELGHCPDAAWRLCSFRDSAASSTRLSHCLSVKTNLVYNHSHTQTSIFENNFTDFLNFFVGFRSRRVAWVLIVFHFPPILTKSFVPLKHTWTWQ